MNAKHTQRLHTLVLMLLPLALGWSACALSDEGLGVSNTAGPDPSDDLDAEPTDNGDGDDLDNDGKGPSGGMGQGGAGGAKLPTGIGGAAGGSTTPGNGGGAGPANGGTAGSGTGGTGESTGGTMGSMGGTAGSPGGSPTPGTGGTAVPAPVDPPASPQGGMTGSAPPVRDPAPRPRQFDFETDVQDWQDLKGQGTRLRQTNERAATGRGSLEVMLETRDGGNDPEPNARYIGLPARLAPSLQPGQTLSMQVWLPSNAQIVGMQPFVVSNDGRWQGTWVPQDQLVRGNWQRVSVQVPADFDVTKLEWLGIHLVTREGGWRGAVFIDNASVL